MCHFWGLNSWELLVASPRPQSFWSRPRSPLKQSHRSGPHCVACLLCPFLFMATLCGEMLRLSHFTGGNGGSERLSSLPGTHSWETARTRTAWNCLTQSARVRASGAGV